MDSMTKYGYNDRNVNQMTTLLNKIERQLHLLVMPLPEGLRKDDWPKIIMEDTIPTWSQYFPYAITELITPDKYKDGYYFIDQNLPEGARILGVKDVDWSAYKADSSINRFGMTVDMQALACHRFALDDVALIATGTDIMSLFNMGIYIEFEAPNKIRLVNANGGLVAHNTTFPLRIFLEHPGLHTISPTMMEKFTALAKCNIASTIWGVLKYYDRMDTQYMNFELQLDTLQEWTNKYDDIIRELDEAHTTAANAEQPLLFTV